MANDLTPAQLKAILNRVPLDCQVEMVPLINRILDLESELIEARRDQLRTKSELVQAYQTIALLREPVGCQN